MASRWRRSRVFDAVLLALALCFGSAAGAGDIATSAGTLRIEEIAGGLTEPWAFGFLPDGEVLITERGGQLRRLAGGALHLVEGTPRVRAEGQGGLLDLMIARDFAQSRRLWLLYARDAGAARVVAMGAGQLSADGRRLEGFEELWAGDPGPGSRHFGARLIEAADGTLLLALGDRGTGPGGQEAQDLRLSHGKILRLSRSGAPLPGPLGPGIYSYGHRNIQGAAFDAAGQLWVSEHGARGGDEINEVRLGGNYGWPQISYGRDYNSAKIGIGTHAPGMEQPRHFWDPSIAPSGLVVLKGDHFPGWRGSLLTGSLKADFIARLDPARGLAEERLAAPETGRVRDLREAADGSLWFLSVSRGAIFRLFRPTD